MTSTNSTINKRTIQSRCDPCFFGFHDVCFRKKDGQKRWSSGGYQKVTTVCNCPCMNEKEKNERQR